MWWQADARAEQPEIIEQEEVQPGCAGDLIDRGPGASVPIGAVIALPDAGGRSYVGGVGTPEMRERFTQYTYQIVVKLDAGSETILERRDASRYRVGDRVRLQGIQLELLAP